MLLSSRKRIVFLEPVTHIANGDSGCRSRIFGIDLTFLGENIYFDNLQMFVFVDKTKSAQYSKFGVQQIEWKFNGMRYKLEEKHKLNEKLTIKLADNTKQTIVPVQFKDLGR